MDIAHAEDLASLLTPAERAEVERAAATDGQTVDDFTRTAILDAIEQAVDTIAARDVPIQHDYAPY